VAQEVVLRISAEDKAQKVILQVADQFKKLSQTVEETGTKGTKAMGDMGRSGRTLLSSLGGSFSQLLGVASKMGQIISGVHHGFQMFFGTLRMGVGIVSTIAGKVNQLSKSVLGATLTMEKYVLQMKGALGTHRIAKEIVDWAMQYARVAPTTFETIMQAITGLARIPALKGLLLDTKNLNKNLSELMEIALGMQAMKPEAGMMGALFALREALTGQMRSLRMRFEIMPEAIAATIGKSVEVIKKSPELFLKAMRTFVLQEVGEKTMYDLSQMLDVQAGNILDALKQMAVNIGEAGFLQAATKGVKAIADAAALLQERMLALGVSAKIGQALAQSWTLLSAAAKDAATYVAEKFLGVTIDLEKDAINGLVQMADALTTKIVPVVKDTIKWVKDLRVSLESTAVGVKAFLVDWENGLVRIKTLWGAVQPWNIGKAIGQRIAGEPQRPVRRAPGVSPEDLATAGTKQFADFMQRTSLEVAENIKKITVASTTGVKDITDFTIEATTLINGATNEFVAGTNVLQKMFKSTVAEMTGLELDWFETSKQLTASRIKMQEKLVTAMDMVLKAEGKWADVSDEVKDKMLERIMVQREQNALAQIQEDMMNRLRDTDVRTSGGRMRIMEETIEKLRELASSSTMVSESIKDMIELMTAGVAKQREAIIESARAQFLPAQQIAEQIKQQEEMLSALNVSDRLRPRITRSIEQLREQLSFQDLMLDLENYDNAWMGMLNGLQAGMSEFAMTAKSSFTMFKDFAREALSDLSRTMSKVLIEHWRGNLDNAAEAWSQFVDRLEERLLEMLVERGLTALVGMLIPGFQTGGTVPRTGLYQLHQGEQIVPAHARGAEKGGGGQMNVINVVDPNFVNEAIAQDPNTIINVIGADMVRNGSTRSTMRGYMR